MTESTPDRKVRIELATLELRRTANVATDNFLAALKAEYEEQVNLLLAADPQTVHAAQGAAQALRRLLDRMSTARETLDAHVAANRKNQERRA